MAKYKYTGPFELKTVERHRPMQVCVVCNEEKAVAEFRRTPSGGHYRTCRDCIIRNRQATYASTGRDKAGRPLASATNVITIPDLPEVEPEAEIEPTATPTPAKCDEMMKVQEWLGRPEYDHTAILTDDGLFFRSEGVVFLRRIGGSELQENFSPAVARAFAGQWVGIVYS